MAPTKAKPMPVLPELASIRVSPGLMRPDFSASSIMVMAILSLMEPPGFRKSHFPYNSQGRSLPKRFKRTVGVLPMADKIVGYSIRSPYFFFGASDAGAMEKFPS